VRRGDNQADVIASADILVRNVDSLVTFVFNTTDGPDDGAAWRRYQDRPGQIRSR
jgi:hypothetical protein